MRIPGLRRFVRVDDHAAGIERAVDDELRFHFEMTVRELVDSGMAPDDARREAERRFGDARQTREGLVALDRTRAATTQRIEWWNGIAHDLRYAMRGIRRRPGFAAAVVLTLGIGVGANATMFGIVDRLLFRPPAYLTSPDRVHRLYFARTTNGKEFVGGEAQYQRLLDLQQSATTIDAAGAYAPRRMAVGSGDDTRDLAVGGMSANLWSLFNATPALGRFFGADDDRAPNGSKVAVLSYSYWQSQYAGSHSVLGTHVRIGPSVYTVIGVAPSGFAAMELETPSMFIPLTASGDDAYGNVWVQCRTDYCLTWLEVFVRRKAGVSAATVAADLTRGYQSSYRTQVAGSPRATPIEIAKPHIVVASVLAQRGPTPAADAKVAAWLLGVAGVVLLIACANVGNLLLGRALRRRREVAVRLALGVSRLRLARQLLVESLALSTLGAVAGLAATQWGGGVLRALLMPKVEWGSAVADHRVALLAAALAAGAGILCGLAPVFDAGRTDLASALKSGTRDTGGRPTRLRTLLLVAQAALSVVLLVGAGLFVQSLRNVGRVRLGYDADHLLWIEPRLRGTTLDAAAKIALRNTLLDRAQHAPGVASAALDIGVPFFIEYNTDLFVPGVDSVQRLGEFHQREVSSTFFATTGTRILRGRGVDERDRPESPRAIVVSDAMAKAIWPNQDALGKCVRLNADTMPCATVVGVAENIKQASLGDDPSLTYYLPFDQAELTLAGLATQTHGAANATIGGVFARTRGDAAASVDAVRRSVQQAMPGAGYVAVTSMSDILAPQRRSWELGATMFAIFGALALVLAGIGLYSVVACSVTERTGEMGVRIALGASASDVVSLVVFDGLRVVIAGIVVGGAIALWAGRWIAPLLFDISPRNPMVFASVFAVLVGVGFAASWLPARRAARVDPNVALRAD